MIEPLVAEGTRRRWATPAPLESVAVEILIVRSVILYFVSPCVVCLRAVPGMRCLDLFLSFIGIGAALSITRSIQCCQTAFGRCRQPPSRASGAVDTAFIGFFRLGLLTTQLTCTTVQQAADNEMKTLYGGLICSYRRFCRSFGSLSNDSPPSVHMVRKRNGQSESVRDAWTNAFIGTLSMHIVHLHFYKHK